MTHQYIVAGVYIGGIILSLFLGGYYHNRLSTTQRAWMPFAALVWPALYLVLVCGLIGHGPVWLGKKVRRWARRRAR